MIELRGGTEVTGDRLNRYVSDSGLAGPCRPTYTTEQGALMVSAPRFANYKQHTSRSSSMSKYHAASKYGAALCGSRRVDGFKTVVVGARDWNDTKPVFRCAKCVAFLQQRKMEATHKEMAG